MRFWIVGNVHYNGIAFQLVSTLLEILVFVAAVNLAQMIMRGFNPS